MHISSSSQLPSIINTGGNRQLRPALQGEPQRGPDSQAPQAGGNEGRLVKAGHDDGRLERINLSLIREQDIPLQNQRAVMTYNATANMGNGGLTQLSTLDLFA